VSVLFVYLFFWNVIILKIKSNVNTKVAGMAVQMGESQFFLQTLFSKALDVGRLGGRVSKASDFPIFYIACFQAYLNWKLSFLKW